MQKNIPCKNYAQHPGKLGFRGKKLHLGRKNPNRGIQTLPSFIFFLPKIGQRVRYRLYRGNRST